MRFTVHLLLIDLLIVHEGTVGGIQVPDTDAILLDLDFQVVPGNHGLVNGQLVIRVPADPDLRLVQRKFFSKSIQHILQILHAIYFTPIQFILQYTEKEKQEFIHNIP